MTTLDEELNRAEQWHAQSEEIRRELEWNNRPREVTRFHELLIENVDRMVTVAAASKLDYVTKLGGFRIYLVESENIPGYRKDFEGQYYACKEYYEYKTLNDSVIFAMFYALRCREGLESSTSVENAISAVQKLKNLLSTPFYETNEVTAFVKKIDEIRENYLGIQK